MPRHKTPKPCACGCGEQTEGGHWLRGHDSLYMREIHALVRKTYPRVDNVTLFIGEHMRKICEGDT
jgi:hypothetical protein